MVEVMKAHLFGILNYTPDSFYDGGKNNHQQTILQTAQNLIDEGASFIDVGAEATNPFVEELNAEEEIKRLTPVLPLLLHEFPEQISLDTYHPETLKWALRHGRPILNDVSGLHSPEMAKLVANNNLVCIVGHIPVSAGGIPIAAHSFNLDSFDAVVSEQITNAEQLVRSGIAQESIILDPCIGFGKTMRLNWELVDNFARVVDFPVMIGASHKRLLGWSESTGEPLENSQEIQHSKVKNVEVTQRALASGAQYLRVHEPAWYVDLVTM